MGYWHKVIKGGWEKTYLPLGWDRKKIAVALVAVIGVIVVGFHFGLAAMMASATPLIWAALPVFLAATILFVWGIIETQGKIYAELSTVTSARIAELEAAISDSKEPTPNYDAYRHVERMRLHDAAFLWSDIRIRLSMPAKVKEHFDMLRGAIQSGKLKFVPEIGDAYMRDVRIRMAQENPHINTIVTRAALKEFAANFGYDPIFLRDS